MSQSSSDSSGINEASVLLIDPFEPSKMKERKKGKIK